MEHWPGVQVPLPAVSPMKVSLVDGCFLDFDPEDARCGGRRPRTVPDELYLRQARDLDLGDPEAIHAFASEFGPLGQPGWTELPLHALRNTPLPVEISVIQQSVLDRFEDPGVRAAHTAATRNLLPTERRRNADPTWTSRLFLHVNEVALHARVLRDATSLWAFLRNALTEDELTSGWQNPLIRPLPATVPDADYRARYQLVTILNAGLRPFQVHIRTPATAEEAAAPSYLWLGGHGSGDYGLYSVLCLQLANHIAEDAPLLRCSAEDCRRLFVRKLDPRYRKPGRRLRSPRSAAYCSNTCEDRQTQRNYREGRRKREAATEGSERP